MKKYVVISLLLLLMTGGLSQAQTAFHKNSLLIALTGGSTRANYSTRNINDGDFSTLNRRESMHGDIDPLIIEFGFTNRFGIGLTAGGESYRIDPNKFYGYQPIDQSQKITAFTSYFTLDFNYHLYVTKKLDVAIFGSAGTFKVTAFDNFDQGNSAQTSQTNEGAIQQSSGGDISALPGKSYFARGSILRTGIKARYYFWKRLGVMAMVTNFSGLAKPSKHIGDNSFGNNYSTVISGIATEFGLCFRFF
jgi:hypothetical protein